MKDIDILRVDLQAEIDFVKSHNSTKYGIYFRGERIAFTNHEYVQYQTKENAYKAMIQYSKLRYGYKESWKDLVDELLNTGELEIKLIQ